MSGEPEFTPTETQDWPLLKSSQLADLFGLSKRRIQQLSKDGIIPAKGRDRYPLRECVQAYIAYLKANPTESASVADLEFRKLKAETRNVRPRPSAPSSTSTNAAAN